jgi:hypothetical protein
MNHLFATWHHPADVDLDAGLDAADHLANARLQLQEIPELAGALRLVEVALTEVSAWFDDRDAGESPQRRLNLREVRAPRNHGAVAVHPDAAFEEAAAQ